MTKTACGVIDIRRLRDEAENAGFAGYVEVEIFSDRWWGLPLDEVIAICIARMKTAV